MSACRHEGVCRRTLLHTVQLSSQAEAWTNHLHSPKLPSWDARRPMPAIANLTYRQCAALASCNSCCSDPDGVGAFSRPSTSHKTKVLSHARRVISYTSPYAAHGIRFDVPRGTRFVAPCIELDAHLLLGCRRRDALNRVFSSCSGRSASQTSTDGSGPWASTQGFHARYRC